MSLDLLVGLFVVALFAAGGIVKAARWAFGDEMKPTMSCMHSGCWASIPLGATVCDRHRKSEVGAPHWRCSCDECAAWRRVEMQKVAP